jgi:hypothetical protein
MPSGPFTKQVPRISGKLNNYLGDAIVGGLISSAPSGLAISQGQQTQPGDRIILNAVDALVLSDTSVGTLYDGQKTLTSLALNVYTSINLAGSI